MCPAHRFQARSRAFALPGFSRWRAVIVGCDSLPTILDAATGMVFALVAGVLTDAIEVFRAVTHDAVAGLPFQFLGAELLIRLMARRAFQLADEFADEDRRCDRNGKMHVGFDAANFVNEYAGSLDDSLFEVAVDK